MNELYVDTGPLVAYLHRNDYWHRWVAEQTNAIASPLYTCEAVITEVIFLLLRNKRNPDVLFDFLDRGELIVQPVFTEKENYARIREIIQTYYNLPASFADACLVCMAETIHQAKIFTLDRDFTIYRTSGGRPLSLICPF